MHFLTAAHSLRLFRKMAVEEIAEPGEALASMECLYVKVLPRHALKRQDRELLGTLGHRFDDCRRQDGWNTMIATKDMLGVSGRDSFCDEFEVAQGRFGLGCGNGQELSP